MAAASTGRRALKNVVSGDGRGVFLSDAAGIRLNGREAAARTNGAQGSVGCAAAEDKQVSIRRGGCATVQQASRTVAVASRDAVQRVVWVRALIFNKHAARGVGVRRHAVKGVRHCQRVKLPHDCFDVRHVENLGIRV